MAFRYFGTMKKQKYVLSRRDDHTWVVDNKGKPFFYYEFCNLFARSIWHNQKPKFLTVNVESYECN